ncbi:hypothetical protein Plhal304r1_c043g0122471 [Plasmopara halstedii]
MGFLFAWYCSGEYVILVNYLLYIDHDQVRIQYILFVPHSPCDLMTRILRILSWSKKHPERKGSDVGQAKILRRRLVCDLETKKTLCCVKDNPEVGMEQLNGYVKKLGPLVNPVFGEQPGSFIDEGYLIPYLMVVYENKKVAAKIDEPFAEWSKWSKNGGRVTTSQGVYILEPLPGRLKVRLPVVAYTPRDADWTPEQDGVQLGWLIDPHPDFKRMYEYCLDENRNVQCFDNTKWRNLDGGDVLPGS